MVNKTEKIVWSHIIEALNVRLKSSEHFVPGEELLRNFKQASNLMRVML